MKGRMVVVSSKLLFVALALAGGAARAGTATLSSSCSLAQAASVINNPTAANSCGYQLNSPPDVIYVPTGTWSSSNEVVINRSVQIRGDGVGLSVLRGNLASDPTFIAIEDPFGGPGAPVMPVSLEGVTVDSTLTGHAITGITAAECKLTVSKSRIAGFTVSGIRTADADLDVEDSTIESNKSPDGGGGIQFQDSDPGNPHSLTINRSTIAHNDAINFSVGGGISYLGWGNSNINNVTISGNTAAAGAGIAKLGGNYLTLAGTTVAFNNATKFGGGLWVSDTDTPARLHGTIVASNVASGGPDIAGPVSELFDSVLGSDIGTTVGNSDGATVTNVDAKLDPTLRDLGGPYHLKAHQLRPGSPAIDMVAGTASWLGDLDNKDQRGVSRPQLGGSNASNSDIGAIESTRFETEGLMVAAKSSAVHVQVCDVAHPTCDPRYSGSNGTNLQSKDPRQFVTYSSGGILPKGTYRLKVGFKKGPTAGRFQLSIGPSPTAANWVSFPVQNANAPSESLVILDLGTVTAGTDGVKYFRFLVPDNASGPSQIFPDFVELIH